MASHILIGSINACIAGDYRYATTVRLVVTVDGEWAAQRLENGAVGGMDGPGSAHGMAVREQIKLGPDPKPRAAVRALRALFDSTITRYGTPSKSFQWWGHGTWKPLAEGVSIAKCKAALDFHRPRVAELVAGLKRRARRGTA